MLGPAEGKSAPPSTNPAPPISYVIPRMRFVPGPVKLPIAHVRGFRYRRRSAALPLKTPLKQIYSPQLRHFKEPPSRRSAALTETGRSRISRPIVRDGPVLPGAAHLGPSMVRFGPDSIIGLISFNGKLPGQRRTTREADLSTQQTGAQAPSRLPRPSRHDRRPQGSRRASRAWPQAPERLSRASRRIQYGSAKAAGGLPRRCQWHASQ